MQAKLAALPKAVQQLGWKSSFGIATVFLPRLCKRGMQVLYAFCRVVDDSVDEADSKLQARQSLRAWRQFLKGRALSAQQDLLLPAWKSEVLWFCRQFEVPSSLLMELVDGAESDLRNAVRFKKIKDLLHYCHQVAGVVGQACLPLFGIPIPQGRDFAERLGRAFQLINIIRDAKEDAGLGRIYFALEDLKPLGIKESDWLADLGGQKGKQVLEQYGQRAEACLREALTLAKQLPARKLRPALVMAQVYGDLLKSMQKDGYAVAEKKYQVPRVRKLFLAAKGALLLGWEGKLG